MRRLVTLGLALVALTLATPPSFSAVPAGQPWRTCMRYGGRDSTVFTVPPAGRYYLDIYAMTTNRLHYTGAVWDSLCCASADTSISTPWSAIVQFKWTDQNAATDIAGVLKDSVWAELPPRFVMTVMPDSMPASTAGALVKAGRDTASLGWAGGTSGALSATFAAAGATYSTTDSTSVTMAVPGSGEFQVWFTKWNRHWIIPSERLPQILPGNLFVRIRPGGINTLKFTYYFRVTLRAVR